MGNGGETGSKLAGLVARLQARLRHGLRVRLLEPAVCGCPDCHLLLFEPETDIRRTADDPHGGVLPATVRLPVHAVSPNRRRGGCHPRSTELAMAEAFSEFSMSSGLGLGAADWSSVAGMGFREV